MRRLLVALLVFPASAFALSDEPTPAPKPPGPFETACVSCHTAFEDAAATGAREDIHFTRGLSCHDCHGGNPAAEPEDMEAAHDPRRGWTGRPARLEIPTFCGKCHSDAAFMKRFDPQIRVDQLSEYRTSVHGRQNAAGDEKVAVCVDCHSVHGIRAVKDPRSPVYPNHVADTCARCHNDPDLMRPYGISPRQYAGYQTSVHARALYDRGDLAAPTCNDCHGSHGATPPGVDSVANVCGSCHTREATLFHEIEDRKGLNLAACIQCIVCHDNHAVQPPNDEMLGVGPKSTCTSCHGPGTEPYKAANEMGGAVTRLVEQLAQARTGLERAERAGAEVSEDQLSLHAAQDALIEARVLAHSFDHDRFMLTIKKGLAATDAGRAAAERAFRDLHRRRLGLAVSLIFILAVISGLLLKIRQIERPRADESGATPRSGERGEPPEG